jgi:hypothetical protein
MKSPDAKLSTEIAGSTYLRCFILETKDVSNTKTCMYSICPIYENLPEIQSIIQERARNRSTDH